MKVILFALSVMPLLGLFKVSSDNSEEILRTELMITKLNTQSSKLTEKQFLMLRLVTDTDQTNSYLKYELIHF